MRRLDIERLENFMISISSFLLEYMALSDASREAIAREQFFQELNIQSMPVLILSDNEAAFDLADGTGTNHCRSKHIDIRYHQVRHFIQQGKVEVSHIANKLNRRYLHESARTGTPSTPRPTHGNEELI
jgi:hypothetical protein